MKENHTSIATLRHPLVKHWVSLRKESTYRDETKSVLLIGDHIVREFPFPIRSLISLKPTDLKAKQKYIATPEILQKIAGIDGYSGLIAEVDLPKSKNIEDCHFVLILDQVQDPGNLGTLLRTALALGWDGVMATPGTVDFFNDKTLRASQGAIFHLPFCIKTPEEIQDWIRRKKITLWTADARGKSVQHTNFQSPIALVLSNEGQGLQPWAKAAGTPIAIPLQNNVESLNVSTAGAILLYQIRGIS